MKETGREVIKNSPKKLGDYYDYQRYYFQFASALFSSGAQAQCTEKAFHELISNIYPDFISVCRENPSEAKRDYAGGWDYRYKYLSIAILLGLSAEESKPLVDALDFWEEPDAGMELMIAYLGHGQGRQKTNTLLWPEAYETLYRAMAPETAMLDREGDVKAFLKNWLKEMRCSSNPAYKNHNSRHDTYFGYWCWEAAAVVVMMDIDDSSFRDHEHYPKDFVDWARER